MSALSVSHIAGQPAQALEALEQNPTVLPEEYEKSGPIGVPLAVMGLVFPLLLLPAAICLWEESKRPESSAEIQDRVRQLELRIEAEQAFAKKHPEDLYDPRFGSSRC